jgi:hypothetical protein
MGEDLLGVAFVAAAAGSGTIGQPQLDRGIDLYLRRLRSLVTVPVQVKALLLLTEEAAATLYIPTSELDVLSGGYLAIVHLPPPHDQLYERLFLIPQREFRKRCRIVKYEGVPCYRFKAQFAGGIEDEWAPFAINIDKLSGWIAAIPGWRETPMPGNSAIFPETLARPDRRDVGEIGSIWAATELERFALERIVVVHDRVRVDPVTFFVHDLKTQRFAGIHVNATAIPSTRGTITLTVHRQAWFVDPRFWLVLVPLRRDLEVSDFVLLIPSKDIMGLGFDESITLNPLTERFRKYQIPAEEFGKVFMEKAFASRPARQSLHPRWDLRKAS